VYRQIIATTPTNAEAVHMLAVLALQTGQPDVALGLLDRAIALKPSMAICHTNRANALLALGQPAEAIAACHTALKYKPNLAEAQQALGHAMTDSRRHADAVAAYQAALRVNPKLPDILNNLGTALRNAGRLDDAVLRLREAHRAATADTGILANLSSVLKELGQTEDAEACLRDALRREPANPVLHYNLGLLLLLTGRFAEGWRAFEARFQAGATPARSFSQPQWAGDSLHGRTLLVYSEQGLGDMIQFCRFVPASPSGRVLFEVPPAMVRLLATMPDSPKIVAASGTPPQFDVVCPMASLPYRLGLPIEGALRRVPYLAADPERTSHWRQRLGSNGFRVGIAWQGNAARTEDAGRSIPLVQYAPLARVPGVRLISLQKGHGADQVPEAQAALTVESLGDSLDAGPDAFLDTAAVMESLDLVITSDTSIAHLAGALGRPVWVALRHVPDYRWMLGRMDSPWYPTMRLFRQSRRDEWEPVFAEMARALQACAGGDRDD
jgi:Flp pilus assembly protein TadD